MHIELFQQKAAKRGAKNTWYWRTRDRGNVTGMNGQFDDRAHAARQAKAHVVACSRFSKCKPIFTRPALNAPYGECWIITWG